MHEFKRLPKTIIYINGFAALTLNEDDVRGLLEEEFHEDDIFIFRNDVRFIPPELYSTLGKNFYNGMCNEQLNLIKEKEGVFINPFVLGFTNDYSIWMNEITEEKENLHVVYVEVPYETYLLGKVEMYKFVDEVEYKANSKATIKLVDAIKTSIKESTIYH